MTHTPPDYNALADQLMAQDYGDVSDIDRMGPHFILLAEAAQALRAVSQQSPASGAGTKSATGVFRSLPSGESGPAVTQDYPVADTPSGTATLEDIASEIRQALVDAAYATRDLRVSAASAMFNAEKIVTAVISKFQGTATPAPGVEQMREACAEVVKWRATNTPYGWDKGQQVWQEACEHAENDIRALPLPSSPATPAPSLDRESPVYRLARLRFFRDIVQADRIKFYKAFDVLPPDCENDLTLGIEGQLFDSILSLQATTKIDGEGK